MINACAHCVVHAVFAISFSSDGPNAICCLFSAFLLLLFSRIRLCSLVITYLHSATRWTLVFAQTRWLPFAPASAPVPWSSVRWENSSEASHRSTFLRRMSVVCFFLFSFLFGRALRERRRQRCAREHFTDCAAVQIIINVVAHLLH